MGLQFGNLALRFVSTLFFMIFGPLECTHTRMVFQAVDVQVKLTVITFFVFFGNVSGQTVQRFDSCFERHEHSS
ncbi:hypothetical protein D3C75_1136030 [compost metagenome]